MSNFNQFANQHPISTQFNPANSSVQYEPVLSPHNTMSQLNPSGPAQPAFNYPIYNPQPYMVPMNMNPVFPFNNQLNQANVAQMVQVPGASNMTPPLILFQSPSPLPFVNTYYNSGPQQPGFCSTPIAVGEINGQFFPVPVEGLQIETQSQSSGSSDQTLSRRTSPEHSPQQPVLHPAPVSTMNTMRPPPGFHSKSLSPPQQRQTAKSNNSPVSWSQRVTRKKQQQVTKSTPPKRHQTSRVKKEPSRKVVKTEGRKKRTKYGYRSKQNKIDTVHENLEKRYAARGILADKEKVLRGADVLRLHVKKFDALTKIEQVLDQAEKLPGVSLKSVSIPLSMKNEFQKKGFLVYCQLSSVSCVDKVKSFFQGFPEFAKCQIAMPNLGNEGEVDLPTTPQGEPEMKPVETGSPELAPVEKFMHIGDIPSLPLDFEKDNFTLDEDDDLQLGILPMMKNASLASVGC